jgi:hypothetical protein
MSETETLEAFLKNKFPVDPPLPDDFYDTPNDERPEWQVTLWNRPYIRTIENRHWPSGIRYDVYCLDGGAWDRPTAWDSFGTIEEAIKCCETGPAYRKPGHFD